MSRSINRSNLVAVRNVTLVVVGVAGVWGLVGFLRQFGRSDPFAALHQKQTVDPFGSMTLKDVEMKHYKGDKLTTRATVKEVAVRRDRQFYDLQGITHGLYQSDRGPLLFAASKGTWDQYRGLLTAKEQVRIANKDFDVQTPMAYFDAKQQTVKMPATLSGRLFKGDIKAASLVFNTSTHDILVKKPSYVGDDL